MLVCAAPCAECVVGPLAFCRCLDGVSLGLLCVRCETFYAAPESISAVLGHFVPHPALAPEGEASWASQAEVEVRGWLPYVASEWVEAEDFER